MERKILHQLEGISAFVRKHRQESGLTELISGDGALNEAGFRDFIKSTKLHKCGVSYAVVAIMGPQSSGKSTLLNHLFETNFKEMDGSKGRSQTTKGVWIVKAPDMDPLTLVLDMEGSDSKERCDEDETTFEKQSALFALAISDIVLINMWCHDIGREQAASRPLLKTIFEVMLRISSSTSPRRTTLFFVIRDKTKTTPLGILEDQLKKDVGQIWKSVLKPKAFEQSPLGEFFNVEVTALPHYEFQEAEFKNQVDLLRKRFFNSTSPGGLAEDRRDIVPASEFFPNVKKIWQIIKENRDLDLPAHKVMVATVRCDEISQDKLRLFATDKDWLAVEKATETKLVLGFGADISSILSNYLSQYDDETNYFREDVRNAKREYLKSEALKLVHPAYMRMLAHLRSEAIQSFERQLEINLNDERGFAESVRICRESCEAEFDERCKDAAIKQANWDDAKTVRKELLRDIETHALLVRTEKLPQVVDQCRERLSAKLNNLLKTHFKMGDGKEISWAEVRSILERESTIAASAVSSAVVAFELNPDSVQRMEDEMKKYATNLVVRKFKDEAGDVLGLMKQRFIIALQEKGSAIKPDKATSGNNWPEPYRKCQKLLSALAVIRLGDETEDNVESVLMSGLMGEHAEVSEDPLDSSIWEGVTPEATLITPAGCKDIWAQFVKDIKSCFAEAKKAAKKCKKFNHWSPLYWVRVGLAALGIDKFTNLLRDHSINLAHLVGDLASKGILKIKDFATAIVEKAAEVMKELEQALKKFYEFVKDIFASKSGVIVVD
ncbi:hypothetical protein C2S52_012551 [Perilla frutescens var. hirtella]|nr:hypothetical protein C2S52_012551 [Perilla frutescens var. hirtella]